MNYKVILSFFDQFFSVPLIRIQMAIIQIIFFIIISSSLLLHTHSADVYSALLPHTVTALTGSCVQIPCTFDVSGFDEKLKKTKQIHRIWLMKSPHLGRENSLVVFNSSENIIPGFSHIEMIGNLTERNCTTVFYNIMMNHSDVYYFRLQMEPNVFKGTFNPNSADSSDSSKTVRINVTDSPHPPELSITPDVKQYVLEGTSVSLRCSAEAPCPKNPPTLSWSLIPTSANITTQLQEKPDKTQSVISTMTFNASYTDHKKNISCTVTYSTHISKDTTVESTIMLRVQFPPKKTSISVEPSASVSVGTNVTLTCKTKASPSKNISYTWYKRGQETRLAWKNNFTLIVTHNNTGWYSCTAQNKFGNQTSEEIQLIIKEHNGSSKSVIYGCTGGLLTLLVLSAGFVYCVRTRASSQTNIKGRDETDDKNKDMEIYSNNAVEMTIKTEVTEDETDEIHYGEIDFSDLHTDNVTRKDPETEYAEIQRSKRKLNSDQKQEDLYAQVKTKLMNYKVILSFFDQFISVPLIRIQMAIIQIIFFIIISSSLLLHTHSADVYSALLPHTVTALTGSCVQIPCTFDVPDFDEKLEKTKQIHGIWLMKSPHFVRENSLVVFNSSEFSKIIQGFSHIEMIGNLTERNCTTVFYNIMMNHSDVYYFRLQMEPNVFRGTFNTNSADPSDSSKTVRINVTDSPDPPELSFTPDVKQHVLEGTSVSLRCSAEAPCPKNPPTLSWSLIPTSANITTQLQEKPDKTQSVISTMTFNASYTDHKKNISCTVTYSTHISKDTTVESTITLRVQFPPKKTSISVEPSASVSVGTNVTLTCKTKASHSKNISYTWYKRGQETPLAWKNNITLIVTHNNTGWYSCTAQNIFGTQSSEEIQLIIKEHNGSSKSVIYGCTGGLLTLLVLSAGSVYCVRMSSSRDNTRENQITDDETIIIFYGETDVSSLKNCFIAGTNFRCDEFTEVQYAQAS
ncbi:uncharacterized protein si:dkeyp-28d2.4 [Triplophysa dalaica]|uniref:uncharacterized protein si:dkeyp-28d2.4 n=1 Tax=Triplophysa dalaica TaxID=1582913 RepID=UPI0024E01A49|nr:uncharacterized protein si:dkeyp-28d2.4 [Triplophysa dalaica]